MLLIEVLLEPMLKFKVESIIEDEHFTKVVLEPMDKLEPLLLEDSIPPGCIQHIISNLMKYKDSEEECNRMCSILCRVYMDDDEFRNNIILFSLFHSRTISLCNSSTFYF